MIVLCICVYVSYCDCNVLKKIILLHIGGVFCCHMFYNNVVS